MARKANTATTIEHTETNEDWVDEVNTTSTQMAEHSLKILDQYGDGENFFALHLAESKVREALERGARAMVDAGRHLVVIKEHVEHGEWVESITRIGLPARAAQKMMQAAVKYLSSPGSQKVLESAGSKTKALELLVLDDDELEQLGDGKTVAGIDLDDVEKMSCSELRKKLREARESIAAKDAVAGAKQQTIDELMEKNARIKNLPADQDGAELRAEASTHADAVEERIRTQLRAAFTTVFYHGTTNDDNPHLDNEQLGYLESRLDLLDDALLTLRAELGIERTVNSPLEFDPSK
ncbi:DUF3102 domain-containing protein [uncultured Gilvimarinus sp.]|uniref:DUF3102 domain-containing protein n=1 Tax=uncultured Gilvimarinus sp. TaxID=1689143 RepID=UPI0030D9C8A4